MPHFFVPPSDIVGERVIIQGEEYHHLINVCRKKVGDRINIFDGRGRTGTVQIEKIFSQKVIGRIIHSDMVEKKVGINLFTAIPKGERFHWLIEKVSELGVDNIYPVIFERSSFVPDKNWSQIQQRRWQKLAYAAAKQSGQPWMTTVHLPERLSEIKSERETGSGQDQSRTGIVAWEKEDNRRVFDLKLTARMIDIFIGPEGGITEGEMKLLKEMSVIPVTLGKYILRVETAAIVCVGLVNNLNI